MAITIKETLELYDQVFLLTGELYDPRDIDFRFLTQERLIKNPDGTPAIKEYYLTYDSETNTFTDLAVKCTFTYESAPVVRRTEDIAWYVEGGEIGATRQIVRVEEIAQ